MSAIDWLNEQAEITVTLPPGGLEALGEAPVAQGAVVPEISAAPLDGSGADATGLLAPVTSGLPANLWTGSDIGALIGVLRSVPPTLPAGARSLYYRLLLTEAAPPLGTETGGLWLGARVDALMALGAVPQAFALLETTDPATGPLFQRWFDAALLLGQEAGPCAALLAQPGLSLDTNQRVFCLARAGDWSAAALTLQTARALGDIDDAHALLLAAFLDSEIAELNALPAPGRDTTPIDLRLREAIGAPLPTTGLPLAFAVADLDDVAGWRAQLDAGERLARTGAIPANQIMDLYTARVPAASGTVWDRVSAIRSLDQALSANEADAISAALPPAWEAALVAGFPETFATYWVDQLVDTSLKPEAKALVSKMGYLTPDYATHATGVGASEAKLAGIAQSQAVEATNSFETALLAGLRAPLPAEAQRLLASARMGEALLLALEDIGAGQEGDLAALSRGLATLKGLGYGDIARQTALSLWVLR